MDFESVVHRISPFPSFWRLQGNLSSARSAHSEELSLLAGERDAATARLEGAEGEAEMLRERVRHADKENEVCEGRGRKEGDGRGRRGG